MAEAEDGREQPESGCEEEELLSPSAGLTNQWSVEDEEEAARERRRRRREEQLRAMGDDGAGAPGGGPEERLPAAGDGGAGASSGGSEEQLRDASDGGTGAPSGELQEQLRATGGGGRRTGAPSGHPEPAGGEEEVEEEEDGESGAHEREELSPQPSYEEEEGDRGLLEAKLDQLSVERDWNPRRWEQAGSEGGPEEGASLLQDHEAEPMDEPQRFSEDPREAEKPLTARSPGGHGGSGSSPPPLSPTTKLTDGVHSPTRSATNSVKKASSAPPVSRIDDHLERYAHAIESSIKAPRVTRQPSIELPSMAVANTKSLWETGEVSANTPGRAAPCKDIVAGDMSKRSLWEQKGSSRPAATVKSTPSGKRYKFVLTGHGKYEKVLADEEAAP
ncbi:lymphocyte-specific protein 1 isoform X3 [Tachyglossus aculeatus]|uniref:lymphocyte-specific protein 1 isoform X3 n=1 Tax=Tachyglossus aculeatus TaxID=9261 RepID=UPI0018F28516|nr:lymphocyte-specific protein 1 isoform X3 [Tachyglossus aculeatus]